MYIKEALSRSNYRVRYAKPEEPQFFPMHFHDGYEILYIASGNGSCFIEGEKYEFGSGDLIITNPNEVHSISLCANSERWHISFRPAFLSEFISENYNPTLCLSMRKVGTQNHISAKYSKEQGLDTYMNNIKNLFLDDCTGKETLIKANLLVLLNGIDHIIRKNFFAPQKHALSDVISYINNNFTNDITVDSIAQHFFLSKSQLSHSFSKSMGISLKSYIAQKRIIYAKELMNTSKKLTEIAFESGFNDYSVFYKAFYRALGVTPSEYRNKL
ncbi:MAG: AraC family transcriptional regulator [Clostridia bacterium]|nr:AraC family transcriptional regulator [Clostridia bacterium]